MTSKIYTPDDPLEVHLELDTTLERRSLMEFICANAKSFSVEHSKTRLDGHTIRFYDSDGKPLIHHKIKTPYVTGEVVSTDPDVLEALEVMKTNNIHATNIYCQPYKHLTRLRVDADAFAQVDEPQS